MRGLQDKRVLITGGASGIGAATAERFVSRDARVVVLDRDPEGRRSVREQLPGLEGLIAADVSNPDEVERAFEE